MTPMIILKGHEHSILGNYDSFGFWEELIYFGDSYEIFTRIMAVDLVPSLFNRLSMCVVILLAMIHIYLLLGRTKLLLRPKLPF
jgi:hypothetical protein